MKKLLVIIGILSSLQFAYAQKSVYTESPDRLFTQGKEMFLNNNYVGCINSLEEYKEKTKGVKQEQEADYMLVSSKYYMGNKDAANLIKDYLEKYPSTYHRNQLCFFIGSTHFAEKDWQKALFWFSQSKMDYLSEKEQEDYSYRAAYANLQTGNRQQAKGYFSALVRNSDRYAEPASYYLAYAQFQDGEYEAAVHVFKRLKNKSEYKENATFFLVQSAFLQGDLNGTISEGQDYISSYSNSKNIAEVYRLLGNSYYRLGNTQNAISNYEKYVTITNVPFRGDMYQLAEAYYQTGKYWDAIGALKNVASTTDHLGQAGQMLLGQSYLKVNNTPNAIMAFDAAARSSFDSSISEEALYNYVMLMNQSSSADFGQAITAAQRFFTEYPTSKHIGEVNEALATTLLSSKNYSAALAAINTIKSPGKQLLEAKQTILFQLAVQDFIDKKYDTASSNFNAVIDMGNYNVETRNEAYFWRGEIEYSKGNYLAAGRDYSTYISNVSSSNKNYPLALYNLSYTNFQTKDYNKALTNFRKYASAEKDRTSPNYTDALNRIGDCYLFSRNYPSAESYYSQAAKANPDNADYADFQLAFVLGLQRNYSGKVSALNNMMSKYPNSQYYDDACLIRKKPGFGYDG